MKTLTDISPESFSRFKETLRRELFAAGAVAVGCARAEEVDEEAMRQYEDWIAAGHHAGMDYLARHAVLKRHPRNVLEDVATVVSVAFSYAPEQWRPEELPVIAAYAYGDDYHDVLRRRLAAVVEGMQGEYGGSWRICIDSAPLAERWWAMKSGIGRRGRNGSIIIDGAGSYVFLAEILTSHPLPPDLPTATKPLESFSSKPKEFSDIQPEGSSEIKPEGFSDIQPEGFSEIKPEGFSDIQPEGFSEIHQEGFPDMQPEGFSEKEFGKSLEMNLERLQEKVCIGCGECVRACPTGALGEDGTIDCRRCINYLTIEHRGDWTAEGLEAMQTEAGRHTLFGCDICQRVCPHNRSIAPTTIPEFRPRKGIIPIPQPPRNTPTGIITPFQPSEDTLEGIFSPLNQPESILTMTQEEFSATFKGSPIKRTKLPGLLRNASHLLTSKPPTS